MRDELISERAEEIRRIASQHGALRVRVFGSRARGEASLSSDLDLLVDFQPGRDLLDLIALKQDLEQLLGCHVDIVEEEGLSPYLRQRVVEEARPL
jgi:predicted nucleotidyltransferase